MLPSILTCQLIHTVANWNTLVVIPEEVVSWQRRDQADGDKQLCVGGDDDKEARWAKFSQLDKGAGDLRMPGTRGIPPDRVSEMRSVGVWEGLGDQTHVLASESEERVI